VYLLDKDHRNVAVGFNSGSDKLIKYKGLKSNVLYATTKSLLANADYDRIYSYYCGESGRRL
jgi:hypothetical protein